MKLFGRFRFDAMFSFSSAGHVPGSQWLVTVVALNAVNMVDMADSSLNEEIRVDIYIDCAIQLRSTLPKNLKFLAVSVQQYSICPSLSLRIYFIFECLRS